LIASTAQAEQKVLRVAMHNAIRILDPHVSTFFITRDFGYMIYDTLFALDEELNVQPQMVNTWEVSEDQLTYTFHLRDGLKFHDGAPVTSEDVIASLRRWSSVDAMGQNLASVTAEMKVVDERTFRIILNEPYGLVLDSLGKAGANVPFIMPKRVAETPASQQITETVGSGPFRFVAEEFQPGVKAVFEKNSDYVPRDEPASGLAGGKVVNIDRVEWVVFGDAQTIANALMAGEIDVWETPSYDHLPMLLASGDIEVTVRAPLGNNNLLRLNWLQPPLDNVKIRQAILHAMDVEEFLASQVGDPEYYGVCGAIFGCGTPLASDEGAVQVTGPHIERAKELLQEGGYQGEPIIVLMATTSVMMRPLGPVAAEALRRIGMNVDLQTMDFTTVIQRSLNQGPISEGGWHIFQTAQSAIDLMSPVGNSWVRGDGKQPGWPKDEVIEKLRDEYARSSDRERQKELAKEIQKRAYDLVFFIPNGQYITPPAHKSFVKNWVISSPTVFWNLDIVQD